MMTLEEILQMLGCNKPFKKDGGFTKVGSETYGKLTEIIMAVGNLTECETIEDAITELDKIADE